MTARIILVTGTGTGIGKTHFAESLLRALGAMNLRTVGLKPIETGLAEAQASDADRLDHASTFHVQLPGFYFADPISPHLAAREAGQEIDIDLVVRNVRTLLEAVDVIVVELPGGLFSPLSDATTNADLARALAPDSLILVALDRLGVLHETIATTRASAPYGLRPDAIVLNPPLMADASTGRNATELLRLLRVPEVASLRSASPEDLACDAAVRALASTMVRGRPG